MNMADVMPVMRTAGLRIPIWLGVALIVVGVVAWLYSKQRGR